jgi:hypothetical protein
MPVLSFFKTATSTPMAQMFEVVNGKLSEISVVLDTSALRASPLSLWSKQGMRNDKKRWKLIEGPFQDITTDFNCFAKIFCKVLHFL